MSEKRRVYHTTGNRRGEPDVFITVELDPAKLDGRIVKARESTKGTTRLGNGAVTIKVVCARCGHPTMNHPLAVCTLEFPSDAPRKKETTST